LYSKWLYYTPSRNYFVGALCALAVFFLSYEYRHVNEFRADNYLSNLASVAALGVAFLPTTRGGGTPTGPEKVVGALHYACAVALFVILAAFCLFLFTRSQGVKTPQKMLRNRIYRICGGIIIGCLVLCAIALWTVPDSWRALFWLESVMVWAVAVSWLVKGEFRGILADQPAAASPR
jgi:peptidoglycan biosynthesis protein MviN/MurJ (putative lipid II flippase)